MTDIAQLFNDLGGGGDSLTIFEEAILEVHEFSLVKERPTQIKVCRVAQDLRLSHTPAFLRDLLDLVYGPSSPSFVCELYRMFQNTIWTELYVLREKELTAKYRAEHEKRKRSR